jgi:aminoglycoside phosphotransferase (APT) family kinase protein
LILRIYPGVDADQKSFREYQNLKILFKVGYPVPQAIILERESSHFDQPFIIIERIPGETLWGVLHNSDEKIRKGLFDSFCKLFVQLHHLDWKLFVGDRIPETALNSSLIIKSQLDLWRAYYDQFPLPDFLPVFNWLYDHAHQISDSRPAVLHWDFHPENVILRPDGAQVVIDWTGLQVSDPRFDLAWTLMLVFIYEGIEWRTQILESYERFAGIPIKELDFFDAAVCLRRLFSIAVSITAGAEQLGMRPGAEIIMQEQTAPIHAVSNLLLERTGIHVPLIESWFA